MTQKNILVFPCGAENAIEIFSALKDCVNIKLFGASGRTDHGIFVFKNYLGGLPFIDDDNFISSFNEIISLNKIDAVIPTHDTVSLFLAKHKEQIGCKIAVPDYNTTEICRHKKQIYNLFAQENFCPVIYAQSDELKYPIFIKPDIGEGGREARVINSAEELENVDNKMEDFVFCEYLPGKELTVDCFTDRFGNLRFSGPRVRQRVSNGISVNSYIVTLTSEVETIVRKINSKLKLRGLWFFQLKQDINGNYKLLEISVRTAGTMCLYRQLGVNFPLLTLYDLFEKDVEILINKNKIEVDRALINRFKTDLDYDTVYIDFDDTITKSGKANPQIIRYLFEEINRGRTIKLITRHADNIYETLEKLCIHKNIFTEIIHLQNHHKKSDYIQGENSIFIDNAFKDRIEVKKKHNIPVFDVDAVGSLIDWRE